MVFLAYVAGVITGAAIFSPKARASIVNVWRGVKAMATGNPEGGSRG